MIPQSGEILGITTGEGQGYAQKFGQSSFDPVAFMENLNAENRQRDRQKINVELQRKKEQRENRSKLLEVPKEINDFNVTAIQSFANEASDKLAELEASGVDIDNDPEARKLVNEIKVGMNFLAEAGQEIDQRSNEYQKRVDEGKISAKDYLAWAEGLKRLNTGTKEGLMSAVKYARENPLYKPKFDTLDFYNDIFKNPKVKEVMIGGGLTKQTEGFSEDEMLALVELGVQEMRLNEPEKLQAYYESGVSEGKWKDYDGMVKSLVEGAKPYATRKETIGGSQKSGGMSINFGSGTAESGDWKLSAAENPSYPNPQGGVNVVTLTYKDQDARPLALTGWKGETVYMKPEKVVKKDVGGGKVQWVVEGKRAKRVTGDQIQREAAAAKKDASTYAIEQGYEETPEGDFINIKETETVTIPVSNAQGSLGEVNYRTISDRTGVDLYDFIGGVNEKRGAGKSPAPAQKKASSSTLQYFQSK